MTWGSIARQLLPWAIVTAVLALYVKAALVENAAATTSLVLTPGAEAEFVIHRWFANRVGMIMRFSREPGKARPELGEAHISFARGCEIMPAGATVRLEASAQGQGPYVYEARPANAFGARSIDRDLSTRLADEPGVYCAHFDRAPFPWIALQPGLNHVRFKVTEVEPPLVGETVRVIAPGSVGIKGSAENVAWLTFALFLEPVLWLTQPAWLLAVLWRLWMGRRRRPVLRR